MLKINLLSSTRSRIWINVLWLLFWIIPWQEWHDQAGTLGIDLVLDFFQLSLALFMFIFPGVCLFTLIAPPRLRQKAAIYIPAGFAFSVLITNVLGLIGRTTGTPFSFVKYGFFVIGLGIIITSWRRRPNWPKIRGIFRPNAFNVIETLPFLLALLLAISFTVSDQLFFIDDSTYLAYLTHWQKADQLDFNEVIFGVNITDSIRFWLAIYPMSQALLAEISGIPGILLLGNYLEIFLMPLALLSAYALARELNLSHRASAMSVLLYITICSWITGTNFRIGVIFFKRLAEDKIAAVFILAPLFFIAVLHLIQRPSRYSLVFVIVTGFCLTLTHPIILFFSIFIATFLVLFAWLTRATSWRMVMHMVVIAIILMAPYAAIRLFSSQSQNRFVYSAEQAKSSNNIAPRVTFYDNFFYGLNPDVMMFVDINEDIGWYNNYQIFRIIPIVIALLAGLLAIIKIKQGPLAWYVLASILLVSLATIPFTGWLLGYIISARMLWRSTYFLPYGLASIMILQSMRQFLTKAKPVTRLFRNQNITINKITLPLLVSALCFILTFVILQGSNRPDFSSYYDKWKLHKQLAQIGGYIDNNTSSQTTVISLNDIDINYLPGLAANANTISFREESDKHEVKYFFSPEEIRARAIESNLLRSLDSSISAQNRINIIKKYNLGFILATQEDGRIYQELINQQRNYLKVVLKTQDLFLFSVQNLE